MALGDGRFGNFLKMRTCTRGLYVQCTVLHGHTGDPYRLPKDVTHGAYGRMRASLVQGGLPDTAETHAREPRHKQEHFQAGSVKHAGLGRAVNFQHKQCVRVH